MAAVPNDEILIRIFHWTRSWTISVQSPANNLGLFRLRSTLYHSSISISASLSDAFKGFLRQETAERIYSLKADKILTNVGLIPVRAKFNHAGSSFHIPATGWQLRCYSSSASERRGIDKNWKLLGDARRCRSGTWGSERAEWGVAWATYLTRHSARGPCQYPHQPRGETSQSWQP